MSELPREEEAGEASLRAFEATMRSQQAARKWSRLAMLGVAVAGLAGTFRYSVTAATAARGYEANDAGLEALLVGVVLAALAAAVVGRIVRDVIVANGWPTPQAQRQLRWVCGVALAVGAAACALSIVYFEMAVALANAALDDWERSYRSVSLGGLEVVIAALVGGGTYVLSTRRTDTERAASGLSSDLARQRRALAIGAGSAIALLLAAFAATRFEWIGLVPFAAATAGALVLYAVLRTILLPSEKGEAIGSVEEVKDEIAAMRRGARRKLLVLLASGIAGAFTVALGIFVADRAFDWINRDAPYYDRIEPGLSHLVMILVAGSLVGLFTHRRLQRVEEDPTPTMDAGGIFDETLAETGRLEVRQQVTLAMLLFGGASKAQYEMVDGGGAWCGTAKESGSWIARLLLGGRRTIDIVIDDLGRAAMRVRRPFVWLFNRAVVTTDRDVGTIKSKLSLRRRYAIADAHGKQRYELQSGWIRRWRFRIVENGRTVGELARMRPPWYVRLFTPRWKREADKFSLSLPQDASLDDRRLLLGALFLVDITHYPSGRTLRLGSLALVLLLALLAGGKTREQPTHRSIDDISSYEE